MRHRLGLGLIVLAALSVAAHGQQRNFSARGEFARANALQQLVNDAARAALTKFADKKLTDSQLSITLIDLRDPNIQPLRAFVETSASIPPASSNSSISRPCIAGSK